MIPLLYPANERSFLSHGLGPIPDATACTVTEDLDGRYELELTLPATSARVADLTDRAIILAQPNPYDPLQPFRVYKQTRQTDLQVTLRAQHISYDLNGFPVWPLTATGASAAVTAINDQQTALGLGNPFVLHTASTDTAKTLTVEVPTPERTVVGGQSGSLRSVFGGELRFDAFDVYHVTRRGADRGCVLAYRKSILEMRQESSVQELYTHLLPYYMDGSKAINGNLIGLIPGADWINIKPVDLTGEFSTAPADATAFNNYATGTWLPAHPQETAPEVSFRLGVVPPGSIGLDGLDELQLGDTVGVRYEVLGVTASSRVTAYTFDVLRERYTDLQIGDRPPTAAEMISDADRLTRGTIPAGRYGAGGIGSAQLKNGSIIEQKVLDSAIAYAKLSGAVQTTISEVVAAQAVFASYINVQGYLTTPFIIVGNTQCYPQDIYVTDGAGSPRTIPGVLRAYNSG